MVNTHEIIREHVINEHLSVGMDQKNRVGVLVDGKWIQQCHHAILQIIDNNDQGLFTMDEAIKKLQINARKKIKIDPDTEFVAHASNIQGWAESGYDPRVLDSRIAVEILLELSTVDKAANKKIEGEMMERFLQMPDSHKLWFFERYYQYLADDIMFPAISAMLDRQKDYNHYSVTQYVDSCIEYGISPRKVIAFVIKHASFINLNFDSRYYKYMNKKEILEFAKVINFDKINVRFYKVSNRFVKLLLKLVKLRKEDILNHSRLIVRDRVFEKACFILALQDPDYRMLFDNDDWALMQDEYKKMDENWLWFMKFSNIHSRIYRNEIRDDAISKEIYGDDSELARDIREMEESITYSPASDYPSLVWSTNKRNSAGAFGKITWKSKTMRAGATHRMVVFPRYDEKFRRIIVYRVVNENGNISYITQYEKRARI
jgi:hypothetical protein